MQRCHRVSFTALAVAAALGGQATHVRAASSTPTLTTLATFSGLNGQGPGALTLDSAGDLFGVSGGGAYTYGEVYELPAGHTSVNVLASFNSTTGIYPAGTLVDTGGYLYGTTSEGGTGGNGGDGTVFRVPVAGGPINTLFAFNGTNGKQPNSGLILSGNYLFGETVQGGAGGSTGSSGTLFRIPVGGTSLTTLATFNINNGASPTGGLTIDPAGDLFGTTEYGYGNSGTSTGTVFELPSGANQITSFTGLNPPFNGANPTGGVAIDKAGNLYATTSSGGRFSDGTVVEVPPGGGSVQTLVSFNSSTGAYPLGSLIVDAKGDLFGTAPQSGPGGDGTIFEIPAGGSSVITLVSFNNSNGANPDYGLIADANGDLFGTTSSGGIPGDGTIFELTNAGFAVPEPSSILLLALPAATALLRRRQTTRARSLADDTAGPIPNSVR